MTSAKALLRFFLLEGKGKKARVVFCGFSANRSTDKPGNCWMSPELVGHESEVKVEIVVEVRMRSRPNFKAVLQQPSCLFLSLFSFFSLLF